VTDQTSYRHRVWGRTDALHDACPLESSGRARLRTRYPPSAASGHRSRKDLPDATVGKIRCSRGHAYRSAAQLRGRDSRAPQPDERRPSARNLHSISTARWNNVIEEGHRSTRWQERSQHGFSRRKRAQEFLKFARPSDQPAPSIPYQRHGRHSKKRAGVLKSVRSAQKTTRTQRPRRGQPSRQGVLKFRPPLHSACRKAS
jgi:hypothetical protein